MTLQLHDRAKDGSEAAARACGPTREEVDETCYLCFTFSGRTREQCCKKTGANGHRGVKAGKSIMCDWFEKEYADAHVIAEDDDVVAARIESWLMRYSSSSFRIAGAEIGLRSSKTQTVRLRNCFRIGSGPSVAGGSIKVRHRV